MHNLNDTFFLIIKDADVIGKNIHRVKFSELSREKVPVILFRFQSIRPFHF